MKEVSKDFKSHFIGAICLSKEKLEDYGKLRDSIPGREN